MPELLKECRKCGQRKPLSAYHPRRKGSKDGYSTRCKTCTAQQVKEWRARNPERHKRNARHAWLSGTYGISLDDYERMVEEQGGRCAACGEEPNDNQWNRLHVDHCHETGQVRGLLCKNCNVALGYALESVSRLRGMIAYLERVA